MTTQARSAIAITRGAKVEAQAARGSQARHDNQYAMRLSLAVGVLMLVGKVSAYVLTGSAAILSDALESVIHVLAVAFAAFSLYLSAKPADRRFPYGYERIAFFSAGFEGALIVLAAVSIIWTAVAKWLHGLEIERLEPACCWSWRPASSTERWVVPGAHRRRTRSIILEANGRTC